MTQEMVLDLANKAITTTLIVSLPILLAALVVGLGVSIFQAVTQINEMTLSFIPKIIAIFFTILLLLPWMMGKFIDFTAGIFNSIPTFSR
jgi:flagellar biosynthetic protein FliQ